MGRTDNLLDLGVVLSLTGATMSDAYANGDDQNPGHANRISLFVIASENASGSSISSMTVKLQVKDSAGNYYDAITTRNDSTGTTQIEHAISTVAGTPQYVLLQSENIAAGVAGFRVCGKADSASDHASDALTVRAVVS